MAESAVLPSAKVAAEALQEADVAILGEVHDNAAHHQKQAEILRHLAPRAVVWEMITEAQAERLSEPMMSDAEATADMLDWEASGWPEFALYGPVFAAAAPARQYGALVPRSEARQALDQGIAAYFGARAADFGLDQPLPEAEQTEREADQMANHCNAMPAEMLPVLVDFQRLRDAALAAAVDQALEETGGPVAVITGNGHARLDRGLAVYLSKARPEVRIKSLGQSEGGAISGDFDLLLDSAAAERPDPCLAFGKG
ncbi:ChaN family lipoprotein [Phaeobacter gallaeciensis]|uniref:ChaN family lipoprotein n=1 Tax=Phaeobacter gallaeciensis TaxID=60890 RepID=A0ABD4X8N9_9RHOB|nr:ChaN family lipoprotein [Phaeobacter gallaeciensis]MDE4144039.1 ChaN family lipoprotein [Phaeobacter gallaeciensis]MDE4157080.1 ChaN family lipoprotein [Phaeobacter gallaeciensis]MDE4161266.1 ChaN family lipoprotein [Phaeobacter gallaeciensis]MDE4165487.1 ChaN family lipoprotein [Phaeobacter gallaeciensis]MDE4169720.1 ChaN family lipoprotein [Phaeobacter gallaeciensis]